MKFTSGEEQHKWDLGIFINFKIMESVKEEDWVFESQYKN